MKSRSGEVSIIRFKKTCTDGFKSTSEDGYSMNLTGSSYSHQLGRKKNTRPLKKKSLAVIIRRASTDVSKIL